MVIEYYRYPEDAPEVYKARQPIAVGGDFLWVCRECHSISSDPSSFCRHDSPHSHKMVPREKVPVDSVILATAQDYIDWEDIDWEDGEV